MKLRCRIGWHKWNYWDADRLSNDRKVKIAGHSFTLIDSGKHRMCVYCLKSQRRGWFEAQPGVGLLTIWEDM